MATTDNKSGQTKREPYDAETRAWIDAAETNEERKKRQQRAKYLRHKEKYKARQRADYARNPEKYAEKAKVQRERHSDKIKADKAEWERQDKEKNPEKYRAKTKACRKLTTIPRPIKIAGIANGTIPRKITITL